GALHGRLEDGREDGSPVPLDLARKPDVDRYDFHPVSGPGFENHEVENADDDEPGSRSQGAAEQGDPPIRGGGRPFSVEQSYLLVKNGQGNRQDDNPDDPHDE